MKELNEHIKRLRQIMSYNKSKGLLVNESQYDMNEQSEETPDVENMIMKSALYFKGLGMDPFDFVDNVLSSTTNKIEMNGHPDFKDMDYDQIYEKLKSEYTEWVLNLA